MSGARVEHALGAQAARERLAAFFERKQIACEWSADGRSGVVSKSLPFVGEAVARVDIGDDAVSVEVTKAPPFPSADTIRRMIVDELSKVLA